MATITAESHLLFGLLALQNGLIDQDQLVAAFPGWARDRSRPLADYLADRGDLEPEQRAGVEAMVRLHLKKHGGDVEKSLAAIPAGRSIRESARAWQQLVARAPSVAEYSDNLAHVENSLANLWKDQGRKDEAEAAYRRAGAIWARLAAEYPKVPNYREGAAHIDNNLAIFLEIARGRVAEAERMYRRAIASWPALVADYPASAHYRNYLAMAHSNLADLLVKRPDGLDAARAEVEAGLRQEVEALRLNPRQPLYRAGLRKLEALRAMFLARLGEHDAAARAIEGALASPGGDPADAYNAACLLAQCLAAAHEDRLLDPADRERRADRYAVRALALLSAARSTGFFRGPERLTMLRDDPDLGPLRDRPDFRLLLMDLAMPADPFAR
jgi:tetratricopeptide (TPR) repeat protein